MILEIADIHIDPAKGAEFAVAVQRGAETVLARATGFQGYKLNQGIESPARYVLMVYWETLENHMVDFRQGPLFSQWRALVGPFFTAPPNVEHFHLVT